MRKQSPSITVSTRVPQDTFEALEAHIQELKDQGYRVSKNSVYVDALELYLGMLKELKEEETKEEK